VNQLELNGASSAFPAIVCQARVALLFGVDVTEQMGVSCDPSLKRLIVSRMLRDFPFTFSRPKGVLPHVYKSCRSHRKDRENKRAFEYHPPNRVLAISFWHSREDAERYAREQFPAIQQLLHPYLETEPVIRTFDVDTSTTHRITAGKAA